MSMLVKRSGVTWLLGIAIGILLSIAPIESSGQTTTTCSSYQNWVQGQYYAAGAIVKYSDGKLYKAKYANPGYNPTISTYYWAPYSCTSSSTSTTTSTTMAPSPSAPASSSLTTVNLSSIFAGSSVRVGAVKYSYIPSISAGQTQTVSVTLGSATAMSNLLVDIRFYNSANTRLLRVPFSGVNIGAGGTVTLSGNYATPSNLPAGTYNIQVGVWHSSWNPTYYYNTLTNFTVGAGSTSPPASSTPTTTMPPATTTTTLPPVSGTTCNYSNWVQGQYYNAGAIVKYSNGLFYRAKYANPGYNPTISTYYWESYVCSGSGTTAPAPAPAPAPAGSAIPLPFRVVATYHPLWTGMRITEVPTSYNQIYLFHAVPSGDGSGRAKFEYGYVVNSADVATVRNRGQRVVLTFGGANLGFNFSNRTQSQNFVTSMIEIINSLGGQVDGVDFNNFEAHVGSSPTEMVWIAQQLKGRYGRNFSISCPPAPDGNWAPLDRQITKAMANAGVLDYAGPQFYDWVGFYDSAGNQVIERFIDEWVAHFDGDASKVMVGYGANYNQGSSLSQVQQSWTRLKAKYPNLRGGFGWSAETDRNAGWTFGNYLGNNK